MEEFIRINPRFLIWVMKKIGGSIKYKMKTVRRESLRVNRPSRMTVLHLRSLQQTHLEALEVWR